MSMKTNERSSDSLRPIRWILGFLIIGCFAMATNHAVPRSFAQAVEGNQEEGASKQGDAERGGGGGEQGGGWAEEGSHLGPPASPVRVDSARLEEVRQMRRVTGDIRARRRSVVASQESGLVVDLPFDAGDAVKKGDLLARLDSQLLELQIKELESKLEEAKATVDVRNSELEQAERDVASLEELSLSGAAKPKELNDARTTVQTTLARLSGAKRAAASSQAELSSMTKRLEHKTIAAPFDGILVDKKTEVGQWVNEGGAVFEMIESGVVDGVLAVPEMFVNQIHPGMVVTLQVASMHGQVGGRVRTVIPMGDARARTFPVKVQLSNPDGQLKPSMSVEAWIPTGTTSQSLTVRKDAILRNESGPYVYVVRGGMAMIVPLRVQYSAGDNRIVVSGPMGPGESVIYEGNERLFPGAPVRVVTEGGGDAVSSAKKAGVRRADHANQ